MQHIVFYLNIFFCVAAVLVHYVFEMISLLATKHQHIDVTEAKTDRENKQVVNK